MKQIPPYLPVLLGLGLFAYTSLATAATITVTTTIDSMDAFDQFCSLREAVHNASNNLQFSPVVNECAAGSAAVTDEIVLVGGATYTLTLPGGGNDQGDLDLFQNVPPFGLDVRIRSDFTPGQVTIRQTVVGQRVIENTGLRLDMQDILIRGGSVVGAGGGILNSGGMLTLNNVNIFSNSAFDGGGIHNTGTVFAFDSQFQLNSATFIGGGAIFNTGSGDVFLNNVLLRANTAPAGGAIYNAGDELMLFNGSSVSLNQANGSHGGAIFNQGTARLFVDGGLFENNTAQGNGGGIYTTAINPISVMNSSFVTHNAVRGGAVFAQGTAAIMVSGSTFRENSSGSHGGAIHLNDGTISGSVLESNTAFLGDGGAIYTIDGNINVINTTVRNNTAVSGGGIRTQDLTLTNSRIEMNSASDFGGGLRVTNRIRMSRAQVVNNTAANGAGLYMNAMNVLPASFIHQSLFRGNQATGKGGGIWLGSNTRIGNTTITLNGANNGGGGLYINDTADVTAVNMTVQGHLNGQDLHKFGTLRLQNSIISTPGQPDCTTSIENVLIISLGNNIADDASCFGLTQPSDLINTDPLLEALADNGGGTMTFVPGPTSLALNRGNNAGCAADPVNNVDQRNAPRPFAGTCDIGAHEAGAIAPADLFANGFE